MLANDKVEPLQLVRHLESKHSENADKPLHFFFTDVSSPHETQLTDLFSENK